MSGAYRSGVMPRVPPVALGGHVFAMVGWGGGGVLWWQCRKCLADVPRWALSDRRWVGVGWWSGMPRAVCMGAVRALESGSVAAGEGRVSWSDAVAGWVGR